jgi:hypothetical protein
MSQSRVQELIAALWPDGDRLDGPQVHYLLDGARDPAISRLVRFGKLEHACLFGGRLTPRLQAAAPYLVHLSAASPLTRELLERGWGNSWGILTVAPPDVTIVQQRLHFKKFLRVVTERGELLAFRFYDPRVLRVYLPTCTAPEFATFMGPVSRIVAEAAAGAGLIEFARGTGGMAARERPLDALAGNPLAASAR